MCGIISVFQGDKIIPAKVEPLINAMLFTDTLRGFDSTGIIFGDTEIVETYKKPVPGYDFINLKPTRMIVNNSHLYNYFIGHNRAATLGSITADNAHPFQHDNITGVHNGTLLTYKSLCKSTFSTDSEHIFKALSEVNDTKEVIEELDGAFALLWHDSSDQTLHFIRNDERPYYFIKVKDYDILLGASEEMMLKFLISRPKTKFEIEEAWEPLPMREYIFDVDSPTSVMDKRDHKEYISSWSKSGRYQDYMGPKHHSNSNSIQYFNKDEKVLFYRTDFSPYEGSQQSLGLLKGETTDAKKIKIFALREDEIKEGVLYEGVVKYNQHGYMVLDNMKFSESDQQFVDEVNPPSDDQEDFDLYEQCSCCHETLPEEKIVYMNDTPICIQCSSSMQNYATGYLDHYTDNDY